MKTVSTANRLLLPGLAVALGVIVAALPARAVPYASGITNDAGTLRFILNEAADNVKVIFNHGASTNDLGPRAKGLHSVALGGATSWEIHVTKSTAPTWTMISDDLNPLVRFYGPRGIACYNDPRDLTRFGRIYVADTAGGLITAAPTASARTTTKGIFVLNADQSDALGYGDHGQHAGITFGISALSPFKIEMGEDGMLYIGDFFDGTATIYRCDPDLTSDSGEVVLDGIGNTANPTVHTTINGSPIAKGSLAGGNLMVWAIDGQWAGTGGRNRLLRWDIGSGPLPHNSPPTVLGTAGNSTVSDVQSDLDIAPDGKFFVMQFRDWGSPQYVYDPNRVSIRVYDTDGTTLLWDSFLQSQLAGLTNATSGDVFRLARAIKVSPDGKRVAVIRNDTQTWIIGLTNGVPDIGTRVLLNTFGATTTASSTGREVSWDAAGNLLAANSTHEKLRVWSPGGTTTAITRSSGTFEIVTPPTVISIAATVTPAAEAGPVHGQFTITRSGDTSGTTTVALTVTGTATSGADYAALPAAVVFAPGQTATNLTVAVVDDTVAELVETVIVTLGSSPAYSLGTASATVAIVDNETPELSLSIPTVASLVRSNLLEGFSGAWARYQLTRRGLTNTALTVNIAYSGSAVRGTDFNGPLTVAVGAGVVTTTFNVTPIDDQVYEGTETAVASVASGTGYVAGSPASATVFVIDDEVPPGVVLFEDRFNSDTSANWMVNVEGTDGIAEFSFDYSEVGVPEAPHTPAGDAPRRGLRFRVNEYTGSVGGISASPLNGNFTGNYRLMFDMWLNYCGPLADPNTVGTTQHGSAGVGVNGTYAVWPNASTVVEGAWVSASTDGMASATVGDYNAYLGNTLQGDTSGVYAAGNVAGVRDQNAIYYGLWGSVTAPAAQLALWPYQSGTSWANTLGMAWHHVVLTKEGSTVTWDVDGRRVATLNVSALPWSTNVFVGFHDMYPGVATNTLPQFCLVDNLVVQTLALPTVTITHVRIVGGNVEIFFTGPAADPPSAYVLQESSVVTPAAAYADVSATITGGGGSYKAVRALGSAPGFYRIKRL